MAEIGFAGIAVDGVVLRQSLRVVSFATRRSQSFRSFGVNTHLKLDQQVMAALRKTKAPVVPA